MCLYVCGREIILISLSHTYRHTGARYAILHVHAYTPASLDDSLTNNHWKYNYAQLLKSCLLQLPWLLKIIFLFHRLLGLIVDLEGQFIWGNCTGVIPRNGSHTKPFCRLYYPIVRSTGSFCKMQVHSQQTTLLNLPVSNIVSHITVSD